MLVSKITRVLHNKYVTGIKKNPQLKGLPLCKGKPHRPVIYNVYKPNSITVSRLDKKSINMGDSSSCMR